MAGDDLAVDVDAAGKAEAEAEEKRARFVGEMVNSRFCC
jgi:hypothetical protein